MTRPTILIVEDDASIAEGLALNLRIEGYATRLIDDGEQAIEVIESDPPDLVLLDISLPGKSGLEVLAELRDKGNHVPVVVLSARQDEYDKVAALRLGADDYVTKPFGVAELLARVVAVLRRARVVPPAANASSDLLGFGDVAVDAATRTVTRGSGAVSLTRLEFELLLFFLQHPSRVFSREELLRRVWGSRAGTARTVDNFVGQLRQKLEPDPDRPVHFVTVRGHGYRFDP